MVTTQEMRRRLAQERRFHRDDLEQLHQPPDGWPRGKSEFNREKDRQEIEQNIDATDPAKRALAREAAAQILLYWANRAARRYFAIRPHTPITWEQLLSNMMQRFNPFLQSIRRIGFQKAKNQLYKTVFQTINLDEFEREFIRRRDLSGAFGRPKRFLELHADMEWILAPPSQPPFRMKELRRTSLTPSQRNAIIAYFKPEKPRMGKLPPKRTINLVTGLNKLRFPENLKKLGIDPDVRRRPAKHR